MCTACHEVPVSHALDLAFCNRGDPLHITDKGISGIKFCLMASGFCNGLTPAIIAVSRDRKTWKSGNTLPQKVHIQTHMIFCTYDKPKIT
jgi:hypothetical protein